MPARIGVVLDEPGFAERTAYLLQRAGFDAKPMPDPHAALEALENAHKIELLVTCADHGPGKPNGISLALMARRRCPGLKVIFIGEPNFARFIEGLGAFSFLRLQSMTWWAPSFECWRVVEKKNSISH